MPLRRTSLLVSLAAVAVCGAAAQPAQAKKHLWSTVNICDSAEHPDDMGITARMPGDGSGLRMYMRFYAQYRDDRKWRFVKTGGRSPWLKAGSARYTWVQRGFTFSFDPPPAGARFVMRGFVRFEWRKRGEVVKRTSRVTSAGHPTKTGDPEGYSAARCALNGPPPPPQPPYEDPLP